jgi:predicted dehydrogenase
VTPIRVALIGFGYAGRVLHAPLITTTSGLTLRVIGTRRSASEVGHPEAEVIADATAAVRHAEVDLVVIATPNESHAPLAEAALGAGKHVVVDKPFTVTLAEARELTARAAASGRVLSVFQNRRWDSDYLALRAALAQGVLGEVVEVRSEMSRFRPVVRDRWRERAGPGAGVWYDLGPHLVDQALLLFGPPATVSADLRIQRHGAGAVDWFHVVLGYARLRVVLSSSMLAAAPAPRFVVRGTRGTLTRMAWDPQEEQLVAGTGPGSAGWGADSEPVVIHQGVPLEVRELPAPAGDYPAYYAALRDAILTGGEPPVTAAQGCTVMAILEAGERSAAGARVVAPDIGRAEREAWTPVAEFGSKNRSATSGPDR